MPASGAAGSVTLVLHSTVHCVLLHRGAAGRARHEFDPATRFHVEDGGRRAGVDAGADHHAGFRERIRRVQRVDARDDDAAGVRRAVEELKGVLRAPDVAAAANGPGAAVLRRAARGAGAADVCRDLFLCVCERRCEQ